MFSKLYQQLRSTVFPKKRWDLIDCSHVHCHPIFPTGANLLSSPRSFQFSLCKGGKAYRSLRQKVSLREIPMPTPDSQNWEWEFAEKWNHGQLAFLFGWLRCGEFAVNLELSCINHRGTFPLRWKSPGVAVAPQSPFPCGCVAWQPLLSHSVLGDHGAGISHS
jgi:hypothetical protein